MERIKSNRIICDGKVISGYVYFENGIIPVDIFPEEDGKWVWVFLETDHRKMIDKWNNRRDKDE